MSEWEDWRVEIRDWREVMFIKSLLRIILGGQDNWDIGLLEGQSGEYLGYQGRLSYTVW